MIAENVYINAHKIFLFSSEHPVSTRTEYNINAVAKLL